MLRRYRNKLGWRQRNPGKEISKIRKCSVPKKIVGETSLGRIFEINKQRPYLF